MKTTIDKTIPSKNSDIWDILYEVMAGFSWYMT